MQGRQNSSYTNNIIIVLNIILFLFLLNFLPFEANANKGLALLVFVGILWLTEAVNVTIVALIVPVVAIFLGLVDTKQALSSFSDPVIYLFFGGFALSSALHKQKLDLLIANYIMRLSNGKLWRASLCLFCLTAFLSMWMSNTAATAMMIPLAMGILSQIDRSNYHSTYVFVLLGIAFSAAIGGMGTLVGSAPNAIVASNLHWDFSDWLVYGIPFMLFLFPIMVATLYLLIRPKLNFEFDQEYENIPLNKERIITLIIFLFIALCWIFGHKLRPLLSGLFGLENIKNIDSVVALVAVIAIVMTRVASWSDIQANTDWGVLMLFGGGLTLSSVLGSSGASDVLANGIKFLIQDGHFYIIALISATFIILLTDFTSNTASAALLVPLFIQVAESLNMDPKGLALIVGLGASCAFSLPVASPPNAIVYGTGEVSARDMLKVGIKLDILCILIISTVAYCFWF